MKNLFRLLFPSLLFAALLTFSSCKPHPEPSQEDVSRPKNDYTLIDNGRAGFLMPKGGKLLPRLLQEARKLNETIICELKLNVDSGSSDIISIARYAADTVMPMEIAFIENTVKNEAEFMGCSSSLTNFGVFDLHGKRFRYKVMEFDSDCLEKLTIDANAGGPAQASRSPVATSKASNNDNFRVLYYFMKNDLDSVIYEIAMTTSEENFSRTDSLLLNFALGFRIFDK